MRSALSVAALLVSAAILAGCSDDGDGDHLHFTCADGTEVHEEDHPEVNGTDEGDLEQFCPGSSTGTGSRSNTTSQAPNQLPVLVLTVTDDSGAETMVTMLDGNLTFSAEGSSDPDGQVSGIAVTVQDSNTTRTGVLYNAATKTFSDVTFTFDRPGVVNVTVAMVDDRAGFTVNQTNVYVNEVITHGATNIRLPNPQAAPTDCDGPIDPLAESLFYHEYSFAVAPSGASWVEATSSVGDARLAICGPDGTALSEEGAGTVQSTPGVAFPPAPGIESYFVAAMAAGPDQNIDMVITVHYEPDTRAAA